VWCGAVAQWYQEVKVQEQVASPQLGTVQCSAVQFSAVQVASLELGTVPRAALATLEGDVKVVGVV
jgi:hypothetical protein